VRLAVMALCLGWTHLSVRSGRYSSQFSNGWVCAAGDDFFALNVGWVPCLRKNAMLASLSSRRPYWFAYFLVIPAASGCAKKPARSLTTIEADFDAHYAPKTTAAPRTPGQASRVRTMTMIKKTFLSLLSALGFASSAAFAAGGEAQYRRLRTSSSKAFRGFDTNHCNGGPCPKSIPRSCSASTVLKFVPIPYPCG